VKPTRLLLTFAVALALSGCPERKQQTSTPEKPTPEKPLNLDKPDQARIQLDLATARAEILKYQQMNGSYPPSLAALGVKLFHPNDISYDPSTGTVTSRTYPQF
jgi:hypothetical protein